MRSILKTILEAGYHPARLYETDLVTYFFLGELLALVDLSTTVKTGVQYSLWGGSVLSLGTEKHRERYCDDIDAFRLPGCFAMTELGHGSNVAGLQTEAVLDVERDEWVISTPDDGALKWWIGNAAEDGQAATVFARLKIPQEKGGGSNGSNLTDHGVHAFVVPIRNGQPGPGNTLPGVEVMDCGYKVGLQGVDNGALRFRGARVPRENLLDRFARVERGGAYSSEFSPGRRFAATLGELTGGRVGLSCSSLAVLKGAVTIAVRYSATRTQFGPPGGAEVAVLDYPSQQEKLMPLLATAYGAHFASRRLAKLYADVKAASKKGGAGGVDEDVAADVHCLSGEREGEGGERRREKREKERENRERKLTFLKKKKKKKKKKTFKNSSHTAGLKAYITAFTANALSVCRAACGGHGYAAANRMGAWRSDHDIFQTFEGDNTVLLQQVAGLLLKRYGQRFQGGPLSASTAYVRAWAGRALPANPLLAHDTAPTHLHDAAFLRGALRHRVRRLLASAAARLAKHSRGRGGAFAAWNRCVPHLLHLANAHIESVIYDELALAAAEASPEGMLVDFFLGEMRERERE